MRNKLSKLAIVLIAIGFLHGKTRFSGPLIVESHNANTTCATASGEGDICAASDIEANANLDVAGTSTLTGAVAVGGTFTASGSLGIVSQTIGVQFNSMRVHDNLAALLPVAAADDDIGNVPGTVGTTAPSLQSVDFGGASADEKATFSLVIPSTYVAGSTVTARFNAGMLTTVSDGTATLDLECWVPDYANADGTVSSDLVTTAAQSINSLTFANKDFVVGDAVAGHALAAGSVLQCRITFGGTDTGNAGDGITGTIRKIDFIIST